MNELASASSMAIANPAFNDGFAEALISSGHVMWAVVFVIMQLLLIPTVRYCVKLYAERASKIAQDAKALVDMQTELRVQKRDQQIKELQTDYNLKFEKINAKIEQQNITQTHAIDELSAQVAVIKNMMEKMFTKIDKLEEKIK